MPEQTAFLAGRSISDAVHLSQELLHNYHLNLGPQRCAIKIDLRKAFDTVRWDFIIAAMRASKIPENMLGWIKECITSSTFTIGMNGNLFGYFKATGGLRQGDPLSPYLFILAMEGLSGIMKAAKIARPFKYHWKCSKAGITHLCFADDLMVFFPWG